MRFQNAVLQLRGFVSLPEGLYQQDAFIGKLLDFLGRDHLRQASSIAAFMMNYACEVASEREAVFTEKSLKNS